MILRKGKEKIVKETGLKRMYLGLPKEVRDRLSFESYAELPEAVIKHLTPFTRKEYKEYLDDTGYFDFPEEDDYLWAEEDNKEYFKEDKKMKICHIQAMKQIKELEAQKKALIDFEDNNCTVSYKEGEIKTTSSYDYARTREEIEKIDAKIRAVRCALAVANCVVKVDGFDVTLGEALILLAQMQNEKAQLESLASRKQKSRSVTYNGVVEYCECVYDVDEVKAQLKDLRLRISDLQIAIDRANLTNYIEVDI